MYEYANSMLSLHVQTETTCIPFVYNKNKLKKKNEVPRNKPLHIWSNDFQHGCQNCPVGKE